MGRPGLSSRRVSGESTPDMAMKPATRASSPRSSSVASAPVPAARGKRREEREGWPSFERKRDLARKAARLSTRSANEAADHVRAKCPEAVRSFKSVNDMQQAVVDLDEVDEQISEYLSFRAVRAIELFRQWDDDGSGRIGKKEFRRGMAELGLSVASKQLNERYGFTNVTSVVTRPPRAPQRPNPFSTTTPPTAAAAHGTQSAPR